jgi:hypothetical protein
MYILYSYILLQNIFYYFLNLIYTYNYIINPPTLNITYIIKILYSGTFMDVVDYLGISVLNSNDEIRRRNNYR